MAHGANEADHDGPRPFAEPIDVVSRRVDSDPDHGLTTAEAAQRLARNGPNSLDAADSVSWFQRLTAQFTDPLVLLLLAALVVSVVAWWLEGEGGWPIDAVVIAAIVVLNAVLGAVQEHRADQAVAALATLTAAQAAVWRDGQYQRVPAADVVVGDVLIIEGGDMIAADGRVTSSESLLVSEASLTGESVATTKDPAALPAATSLAERSSMVHAGTAAVSGHGRALVTATAMNTEVGHIAHLLAATENQPTPLEREIARVGRLLGAVVIVIAIVIAAVTAIVSEIDSAQDVVEVLLIGVSVAVAAVPEGLPAVLSIVLAIGVQRMARRHALVKRLASAETLGSATAICTDKTGTLTRNEMTVRTLVLADHHIDVATTSDPNPLREGGDPAAPHVHRRSESLLLAAALASNVETSNGGDLVGAPTETALVRIGHALELAPAAPGQRVREIPFSSDRKRMTVIVEGFELPGAEPGTRTVITKGAPDVVLPRCATELTDDGPAALGPAERDRWAQATDDLADRAMRTLVIAARSIGADEPVDRPDDEVERDLQVLALVGIMDPPRREAAPAVAAAHSAGIRVIMMTGDHPHTGARIATDLGIGEPGQTAVTGNEIDALSDDELVTTIEHSSVFARVTPAHKLRMVHSLQATGHVVAMTGDGVNDAPALKAADIGTAMGATGTDVAREAADMVLTNDDFSTIISAVAAGRTIFANVRSFLRYLLSSNIGEVLTMFLGVVLAGVIGLSGSDTGIVAPLTAVQILWINLLTDTGPALALGVDPADPNVMQDRPRQPGERVIDRTMMWGIGIVGLTMAVATLLTFDAKRPGGLIDGSADLTTARTAAFTVLVLAQLFNCFSARSDSESAFRRWAENKWLLGAVAMSFLLQVAVVHLPPLHQAFDTDHLTLADWGMAFLVASSVLWVAEIRKLVVRRTGRKQAPA